MYLGGSKNETELKIDLFNGSTIQIFGADHPDSLRGMGFHGVVLDEYALMAPRVWTEIIRPAISDHLGWVMFIGTPMGHNQFWEVYDFSLRGHKDWFGRLYRASETKVIPEEELRQAQDIMTDEQYDQEFECSFTAAVSGSYYRKQWDEKNQVFKNKPLHDWCSHAADSFRYGCVHDPIDTTEWNKPINVDYKYIV
jgi:phage terminase large subunit